LRVRAAESTQHTIELTRMAMEQGADACTHHDPSVYQTTQQGLFLHYKNDRRSHSLATNYLYIPSRTACDILPETLGKLAPSRISLVLKKVPAN